MQVFYYPTNGLNPYTGYGKFELGIAKGLELNRVRPSFIPTPDKIALVVGFADWLTAPNVAHSRKWLITMSESTRVSQRWVALINDHAERVLVPSPALIEYYKESGVVVPVHSIGCGVDVTPSPLQKHAKHYRYLTYSYGDIRKGAELAILAFRRIFSGSPHVTLTIKARDGYNNTWLASLADDPQITVIGGQQSDVAWHSLIAQHDCFVFPSRAEGFGLPPREATLLGIPTIATRWLGMDDVDNWGYPIGVRALVPCQYESWDANDITGKWADPNRDDIAHQMQTIFQSPKQATEKARDGARYLAKNNNWKAVGKSIKNLLEAYA